MSNLNYFQKQKLENLLEMSSGYTILDSNRLFNDFFIEGLNIKKDYLQDYNISKAKRLRIFWDKGSNEEVISFLTNIKKYRINNKTQKEELSDIIKELKGEKIFDREKAIKERFKAKETSPNKNLTETIEKDFLAKKIPSISLSKLNLDTALQKVIKQRIEEIEKALESKSPLSGIFLIGSIMEALFLNKAGLNPQLFNQSNSSPKDKETGGVKQFHEWSLSNFINVARDINFIEEDTKKFSSSVREFRNYIHPRQQIVENFSPNMHTFEICHKVLQKVILELSEERTKRII